MHNDILPSISEWTEFINGTIGQFLRSYVGDMKISIEAEIFAELEKFDGSDGQTKALFSLAGSRKAIERLLDVLQTDTAQLLIQQRDQDLEKEQDDG